MAKFRKKPIVIEAEQWDGSPEHAHRLGMEVTATETGVQTLEGWRRAKPGCWIAIGVKGEKYPIDDDIFRMTYEAVE